jgi:transposase
MQRWNNRDELAHQVVMLDRQGVSRRAIARSTGVSRNTVRKILMQHQDARDAPHTALPSRPKRVPREQKIDRYANEIAQWLKRYPDMTAQRVFEELVAVGYDGKYTTVKDYVRRVRPTPTIEPSLHTPSYSPGEMAESDWTPCTIDFTTGVRATVQIFGYVLWYSKRKNFRIYERADLHALMDGHVRTFERFNGAAHICKYDNQKAVVLGWEGQQPIYNPRFLAFATHYEFRPHACHRQSPNEKPHVERSFWQFERSFLNGRSFRDVEDMRAQLATWVANVVDTRPHKRHKRPAIEMFDEEASQLVPLPKHPYDVARVLYRVCSIDGFVAWDGNRYAVPYEYIYELLPVRIGQRDITIYAADLRAIASHALVPRSAGKDVGADIHHRPSDRRSIDLDQLQRSFDDLGEQGSVYFAQLMARGTRQCGYHGRQVLLMRERFSTQDVMDALAHACAYGAIEHTAIERILTLRARPRTLAEYVAEQTAERIEKRLGRDVTTPRDLREYDELPVSTASTAQEEPCNENRSDPKSDPPPTT